MAAGGLKIFHCSSFSFVKNFLSIIVGTFLVATRKVPKRNAPRAKGTLVNAVLSLLSSGSAGSNTKHSKELSGRKHSLPTVARGSGLVLFAVLLPKIEQNK